MILEAIWAVVLVGVPITSFTLAIVWWGLRNGHFEEINDSKELGRELKKIAKGKIDPENDNRDFIQKKWAKFGGGFYGVVAFFTWLVVEIREIFDMIVNIGGLWAFLKQINIGVIIELFISAITNFVTAMVWPVYWMKRIDTNQVWMFFMAAYGGYVLGMKLAQQLNQRRTDA